MNSLKFFDKSRKFYKAISAAFSLFIIVILVLLSVISVFLSVSSMKKRAIEDTNVTLIQLSRNISRYITNAMGILDMIYANKDLNEYLVLDDTSTAFAKETKQRFTTSINYIKPVFKDIDLITVFDNSNSNLYISKGFQLAEGYDIKDEKWYQKASYSRGVTEITGTHVRSIIKQENKWVITLSRMMVDRKTYLSSGITMVDIKYNVIEDMARGIDLGKNGYVFVVDNSGDIIYHPDLIKYIKGEKKEHINEVIAAKENVLEFKDEGIMYNVVKNPGINFYLVGVVYINELASDIKKMILINSIIAVIMIMLALLVSRKIAKVITRPLSELEVTVSEVQKGNLDVDFKIDGTEEVTKFAESLQSMVSTVKRLMAELLANQEKIRTSEIKALQAQINPHFLYNTLNSIVWIADNGEKEKVKDITLALADYFRIVLSSGKDIITVREEVEHIKNYLIILKVRYEQLNYTISVDEKLLDYYMPKLLLQPIVENAIYHGIKNNSNGGTVLVQGKLQDDMMVFDIIDDGRGMRESELQRIFDPSQRKFSKQIGIGLNNIKERIELYYNKKGFINIASEYKKGTVVTIGLPIEH